jgi:hypothetical protein
MGRPPKRIRERRAGPERQGRDDHSSHLRYDMLPYRRPAVFELGEAGERLVVLDTREPQQHRLRRWRRSPLVLPQEIRVAQFPLEIPLVVVQHPLSDGRMHHAPWPVTPAPTRDTVVPGSPWRRITSSRRLDRENHLRPRVAARGSAFVFTSSLLSAGPRWARPTAEDPAPRPLFPHWPSARLGIGVPICLEVGG